MIRLAKLGKSKTCLSLLEDHHSKKVTVFNKFDFHLLSSIPLQQITEFCGKPATGKTQICLQLCLYVQISCTKGDVDGKAIFIDTRQDFNPQRLRELSEYLRNHFKESEYKFNTTRLMGNVYFYNCPTFAKLYAIIVAINDLLRIEPVKLIIIDSFSFALRMIRNEITRVHFYYEIMRNLRVWCQTFDIAIIITNEITTSNKHRRWSIKPALGDTHSNSINHRITLTKYSEDGIFFASAGKSKSTSRFIGKFQIDRNGISDRHC